MFAEKLHRMLGTAPSRMYLHEVPTRFRLRFDGFLPLPSDVVGIAGEVCRPGSSKPFDMNVLIDGSPSTFTTLATLHRIGGHTWAEFHPGWDSSQEVYVVLNLLHAIDGASAPEPTTIN